MLVTASISKIALCFISAQGYQSGRFVGGWFANRKQVDHMLTIFGKKKKEDSSVEIDTGIDTQTSPQTSSGPTKSIQTPGPAPATTQNQPTTQSPPSSVRNPPTPPLSSPSTRQVTPGPTLRTSPMDASFPAEETSLSKLLQSLLQDIPADISSGYSSMQGNSPEFVPPRATPPSRAMIIGHGDEEGDWEEQGKPSTSKQPPSIPSAPIIKPSGAVGPEAPVGKVTITPPPIPQKRDQTIEPAKVDKPLEKPKEVAPKKPARPPQSFDHIFELTQGNLESPGFVIINGPPGAGKTTLCSGLASNYLKRGDPCLYVTYDQAPTTLRDQMKKLGSDPSQYESQYRFIVVDGYASQSDTFSMEATYLDQPFNFESIQDTLVRNTQIFMGEKIRVIFDSIDKLATKVPPKDFVKSFTELAGKLKDSGATLIVTVDMSELPKDLAGSLTDLADCIADLSKDDSDPNERELKVQRLNQKSAKIDAETFEIDSSKGLVFV
jgi:KaiC/GvpD/RAD55 family RecA-like ATPase